MRYWTTFYIGGDECSDEDWYQHGYRNRHAIGDILKVGNTSECSATQMEKAQRNGTLGEETGVMLALVDPTDEELMALGNAVVYDPNRFIAEEEQALAEYTYRKPKAPGGCVRLVIDPQDYDNLCMAIRKANNSAAPSYWSSTNKATNCKNEDFTLIRNGKIVSDFCMDCKKVIGRAAGKCSPPLEGCTNTFFTPEQCMTLPSGELYMTHRECMKYESFQIRQPRNLDVTVSPGNPVANDASNNSAVKAGYTRSLRTSICKYCSLGVPKGKSFQCGGSSGWFKPGDHCSGPVFDTELPMPNPCTRQVMWLTTHSIGWNTFKKMVASGIVSGADNIPKWRKDPDIQVGYYDRREDTVTLYAYRIMKPRAKFTVELKPLLSALRAEGWDIKAPPKECSALERLVGLIIDSREAFSCCIRRNTGFGNSSNIVFAGAQRHFNRSTGKDSFNLQFQFNSLNEVYPMHSTGDVAGLYYAFASNISDVLGTGYGTGEIAERSRGIVNAFGNKEGKKYVKKFMKLAHEQDVMGLPIPKFSYNGQTAVVAV